MAFESFSPQPPAEKSVESQERFVAVTRVSTVFDKPETLEHIADRLLQEGAISGFTVEPVRGGYLYEGKKVVEGQFQLNILIETPSAKARVVELMKEEIGKVWDYPIIKEEQVSVNESLLKFVERAKMEHERYRRERRKSLALALSTALGFLSVVGGAIKMYGDKKAAEGALAARKESVSRLVVLEQKLRVQANEIEGKVARQEPLTEIPTDMGAGGYQEFSNLIETVREAEHALAKAVEAEEEGR